jgi:hypothetical protein
VAFDVLKKKRRATRLSSFRLAHPVGDFRDFQDRVYFGLDALQLAGAVQSSDPLAKVSEGQRESPWN